MIEEQRAFLSFFILRSWRKDAYLAKHQFIGYGFLFGYINY
jgi:hypothetical protein